MKQLFIALLLVFVTLFSFGQRPNAITFADSTIVKNSFGTPIPFYEEFHIVDLKNNNGFNIINFYDDASYEPKYLFLKRNFDGTSISDTIYHFNPLNAQGYAYGVKATTKLGNNSIVVSAVEDANYNAHAFVFSVDQTGNILWNKHILIDSVTANIRGAFADEANNNVIFFGSSEDYISTPSVYESFITKINGNGVLVWSKKFAYVGSDTNELHISAGTVANDGDYIFAAKSWSPSNQFYRIFKTDTSGSIVWDMPINVVNQPGNDTINPSESKSIHKVIPLKDGNAILVASVMNGQAETDNLVLINFNQSTGNINYSKKYTLPVDGIYVNNVGKDNNDNVVLSYEDPNNPFNWLVKIDKNGIVISSHRIFDTTTNTEWIKGFSSTEDGGFIVINNRLNSFQSPEGIFVFKTNKNLLLSSCADSTLGIFFTTENINTFNVSIPDNIYTPSINEGSLTYAGNTSATVTQDLYCDCQISISGIVHDINSVPASNTTLYLYKVRPQGQFILFDSTVTDLTGNYLFDYLPEEPFIIRSTTNMPNTISTYYGSPNDHSKWDSAWVFNLSCSNPTLTGKDITLIPTVPQTGNGVISGFVYELNGFGTLRKGYDPNNKALGDPIPDIDITVNQSPGGAVGIATTDPNGGYTFTGLNVGANFEIVADIPGLPNDSMYTVNVTVTNNNFDSLNFYVDSVGIFILDSNIVTAINIVKQNELSIELMPNPTNSNVNVIFTAEKDGKAVLKIMSYTGATLIEKQHFVQKGSSNLTLDLAHLSNGIYFMQIQLDNKVFIKKIIKQ